MDQNELRDYLDSKPEEIREAILNFDLEGEINKIAEKHSLNEKQTEILDGEIVSAVLGKRRPNNLAENLVKPDGGERFSTEKAKEIREDFHFRILEPIMQDAEERGFSFSEEENKSHDEYTKNNEIIFQKDNIRVTGKTFEQGGHSYPIRNISKVVDFHIWNLDFGGTAVNAGILIAGIVGLTIEFIGCKIVGIIGIVVGGFNLYNMLNTPKTYYVKLDFVSGDEVEVKYDKEETAKKLRRAIDNAMKRY
jgi:hypothetical protein